MLKTIICGALLMAGIAACASTPSARPPGALTAEALADLNTAPDISKPYASVPAGMMRPIEISDDGVADWLIRWPESVAWCGTGGCRTTLFVSTPTGLVRAFDVQSLSPLERSVVNGEVRLEGSFHHMYCDEATEDCRVAWGWDAAANRLVPRPSKNGQTRAEGYGVVVDPIWTQPLT